MINSNRIIKNRQLNGNGLLGFKIGNKISDTQDKKLQNILLKVARRADTSAFKYLTKDDWRLLLDNHPVFIDKYNENFWENLENKLADFKDK